MHLLRRVGRLLVAAAGVVAAVAAVAALGAGACGPAAAPEVPGRPGLVVGLEAQYPPFESVDATGAIVGFDVDLVRAFAASAGREAELRNLAFDALIPELQSGRIDAVCSGMSWTAERAKVVDFSRPYLRTTMAVLVHRTAAAGVERIADLDRAGIVIAVQRGTTGETKAKERFPAAEVRPFDNEVDASSEVAAGRAHAFVYDMASVRKLAAKAGDAVRVLDGDLGSEDYCMAFPKGSPLVAEANAFLGTASAPGGVIDELIDRWKPVAEPVRGAPK